MADRPPKRARTSSNNKPAEPSIDPAQAARLPELLATLDQSTIKKILLEAATHYPRVAKLIEKHSDRVVQAEKAKVINFDYHSKSVWKTINVQYSRLSGSQQFDASGDAYHSVKGTIKDIKGKCPAHAGFETKVNALEALRKIGKVIALSGGDVIAKEIHKSFYGETDLEKTMLGIVQSMTPEERETTSNEPHKDTTWIEKLMELKDLADEAYMFEGLYEVINTLAPQEHDEDDDELEHE